jgi:hypothetical protein
MIKQYRTVGIFSNRQETETAIKDFLRRGFLLDKIAVIAKQNYLRDINGLDYELTDYDHQASPWVTTDILTALLFGLGLPPNRAKTYNTKINEGGYLVIVGGTASEIKRVEEYLIEQGKEEWEVYEIGETDPLKSRHLRIIGAFPNLSKAKTALIKLIEIGYPLNKVTLFIADDDRHNWFRDLKVSDRFDSSFSLLPLEKRIFFQDCFALGEYILMVDGVESEIRRAETILKLEEIQGFYAFNSY